MTELMRPIRWIGSLLLIAAVIGLAACGGGEAGRAAAPESPQTGVVEAPAIPTPRPTATPEPAPTNTPEPTPEPTEAPAPTATAVPEAAVAPQPTVGSDDAEERVRAYAEQCAAMTEELETDPMAMAETEAEVTWGDVAAMLDLQVETYSQLEPPPEVREYHDSRLATLRAFRDHAKTRPTDGKMIMDIEELMTTVFPQAMAIGMDQSKPEEQKQQEIEQLMEEPLMKLFGTDFPAADQAEQHARERLPANLRNILDKTGCSSPDEGMQFP